MKKLILTLAMCAGLCAAKAKVYTLTSPDGRITAEISVDRELSFRVSVPSGTLIDSSPLGMVFDNGICWGDDARVVRTERGSVRETIPAPFYKRSHVEDHYNQLAITFRGGYGVEFRAYDDGVVYRFRYLDDKPLTVVGEKTAFNFEGDPMAFAPYVRNSSGEELTFTQQFANSFENVYDHKPISKLDKKRLSFLPLAVQLPSGYTVCITEADLESYPGMFLTNSIAGASLHSVFAPCPRKTEIGGNNLRKILVTEAENHIARIDGARTFPWRVVAVAEHDAQLADNDMVYRLSAPCRLDDTSWIKPGKVAWEWWNDWGVYGVDFKSGVNTETYKYYIDFAAENGIEYVILDEGWSVLNGVDLMRVVPEIDLREIVGHGNSKRVGIILWASYAAFAKDIEGVCKHYSQMGVKGFKVDFMDRDDQPLVDFIYESARTAAKYHLILDLHGMYKPTGLQRTYPNILNIEGVFGLETAKWTPLERADQVVYDVTIPFIRQLAGPMDYTQGAMRNANRENFRPVYSEPMSPGTRCRQLAQYVIFESPLNMLCDSPVKYREEPECLKFIAEIPTVWDHSLALGGRIGRYVTMARRSGDTWYVGGMTDWDERDMEIDLSFLGEGSWRIELFRDGVNADRYAQDYKREIFTPDTRKLNIKMVPGGGFAAKITLEK